MFHRERVFLLLLLGAPFFAWPKKKGQSTSECSCAKSLWLVNMAASGERWVVFQTRSRSDTLDWPAKRDGQDYFWGGNRQRACWQTKAFPKKACVERSIDGLPKKGRLHAFHANSSSSFAIVIAPSFLPKKVSNTRHKDGLRKRTLIDSFPLGKNFGKRQTILRKKRREMPFKRKQTPGPTFSPLYEEKWPRMNVPRSFFFLIYNAFGILMAFSSGTCSSVVYEKKSVDISIQPLFPIDFRSNFSCWQSFVYAFQVKDFFKQGYIRSYSSIVHINTLHDALLKRRPHGRTGGRVQGGFSALWQGWGWNHHHQGTFRRYYCSKDWCKKAGKQKGVKPFWLPLYMDHSVKSWYILFKFLDPSKPIFTLLDWLPSKLSLTTNHWLEHVEVE